MNFVNIFPLLYILFGKIYSHENIHKWDKFAHQHDTEHREEWYRTHITRDAYVSLFLLNSDPTMYCANSDTYCNYGVWGNAAPLEEYPGKASLTSETKAREQTCGEFAAQFDKLCYAAIFNLTSTFCHRCVFAFDILFNDGLGEENKGFNYTIFAKFLDNIHHATVRGDYLTKDNKLDRINSLPTRRYQPVGFNYKTNLAATWTAKTKHVPVFLDQRAFRKACPQFCHCGSEEECEDAVTADNEFVNAETTATAPNVAVVPSAGYQFCLPRGEADYKNCGFAPHYHQKWRGNNFMDCKGWHAMTRDRSTDANHHNDEKIVNAENVFYDHTTPGCPEDITHQNLFAYKATWRKLPSFDCAGYGILSLFPRGEKPKYCEYNMDWNWLTTSNESIGKCGDSHNDTCPIRSYTAIQMPHESWRQTGNDQFDRQEAASYNDLHCGGCLWFTFPFNLHGPENSNQAVIKIDHYARIFDVFDYDPTYRTDDIEATAVEPPADHYDRGEDPKFFKDWEFNQYAILRQMKEKNIVVYCEKQNVDALTEQHTHWHVSDGTCDSGYYVKAADDDIGTDAQKRAGRMAILNRILGYNGSSIFTTVAKQFVEIDDGGDFTTAPRKRVGLVPTYQHCPQDCPVE